MNKHHLKIGAIVFFTSLFIGAMTALIIGGTADHFVFISPIIVSINTLIFAVTVLFCMYLTQLLSERAHGYMLLLALTFAIMLGTGILSFIGFFIAYPGAFLYSGNLTVPYLLVNFIFFTAFNIISNGFVLFQQSMIQREKERAMETLAMSKMEAELQANQRIMDSIQYAKRIQASLLPRNEEFKQKLPESFCIWQPRDIVGGDVYFSAFFEEEYIIAVIDCTGHGVPGAFMTMLASSGLDRIINRENVRNPAEILKRLNAYVKRSLRQDSEEALSDDGLDISVCRVFPNEKRLTFAGSKLPLTYIYNSEVHSIKGDRHSLGYKRSDLDFTFKNHEIEIKEGMSFYLYTDGIVDQVGGEKRFSFGRRRFGDLLVEVDNHPSEEKKNAIIKTIHEFKGPHDILDDITVIGFKVAC